MSATIHTCTVAVSHRIRSFAGRTWPALLTLLALVCVTPPAPANASPPAASGPACDGGPCGEQKQAPTPQPTAPLPALVATPTEPGPTAPMPTPSTSTSTSPAAPAPVSPAQTQCDTGWPNGRARVIQMGKREDDGKPLQPFNPRAPLYPYELRGSQHLYREAG